MPSKEHMRKNCSVASDLMEEMTPATVLKISDSIKLIVPICLEFIVFFLLKMCLKTVRFLLNKVKSPL